MIKFGPTFIWTAFNLLVLYFVLRKILFKPVTSFMENRIKSIKDQINEAERNKIEAEQLKQKYSEQIKNAKLEAENILSDAQSKAIKEYDTMVSVAKKEAESVLIEAREEIERERLKMMKEVKNHVVSIAISAASKVIEANMDTENNRKLVSKFIDEVGAA